MSEEELYKNHRMYILVKEEFPPSVAINSSVHLGMNCFMAWSGEEEFDGWRKHSFRKVTCMLSPKEFETIEKVLQKTGLKKVEQVENRLGGVHILTGIYPFDVTKHEFKAFKFLRLYKWKEE